MPQAPAKFSAGPRSSLCSDGLHPAHDVHLPNPALTLIAPEAPIADTRGMASHLVETLVWLGVSAHPSA